jgi:hypothetical protein
MKFALLVPQPASGEDHCRSTAHDAFEEVAIDALGVGTLSPVRLRLQGEQPGREARPEGGLPPASLCSADPGETRSPAPRPSELPRRSRGTAAPGGRFRSSIAPAGNQRPIDGPTLEHDRPARLIADSLRSIERSRA